MLVLPILLLVIMPLLGVALVVFAATQPAPQRVVRRGCAE